MTINILSPMLITIVFVILGFFWKKSKLLFKIQIIWMWILTAFNTGGADWGVHVGIFNDSTGNIGSLNEGGLYSLICFWFKSYGYDFITMNAVVSTVIFILLYINISKYATSPSFTMSLFFIYPFIDCTIQKRFFLASVIIIISMKYLFENRMSGRIKYVILCIIAAQIHVATYGYLIFALFQIIPERKIKKFISISIIAGIFSIPLIPSLALFIFPASKVGLYFSQFKVGISSTVIWILFHCIFVLIFNFVYKKLKRPDIIDNEYIQNIYKLNINSLIFLPLYYYEPTFIRYYRNLLLFNYIVIGNFQPRCFRYRINTLCITIMQVLYAIFSFVIVYCIAGLGFDSLVVPVFSNNLVLNFIFGV